MESIALIGQAIAVIAACWAIISGVGAWKREFIGKRRIELAEGESELLDRGYIVFERYESRKEAFVRFNILK